MNKLDVALKLLQLLNERKMIDSKIVANELNVSLRTAQRYLVELSILPCVASKVDKSTYSLNPDYKLHGALKAVPTEFDSIKTVQKQSLSKMICLLCGSTTASSKQISSLATPEKASTVQRLDRLAALISRRLKERRCSFP